MISLLIAVIYLVFISLGLPDSLLGSAWPIMYQEFDVPISYSGIVFLIISGCTVFTSLHSDRLIKKFGTGKITFVSVLLTAISLFGFAFSKSYISLCFWSFPYGLGAGSIDVALNNYVALHYESRHMSWLHCMWGLGASVGPYIMSYAITKTNTWCLGYTIIGIIQMIIAFIAFMSISMWKDSKQDDKTTNHSVLSLKEIISIPGAKQILISFFCYCAIEQTVGLWASSYLVLQCGLDEAIASGFASLFYIGITIGRALNGFLTYKLSDSKLIYLGLGIICLGTLLLLFNISDTTSLIGFSLIGLGCAPVYPCVIHSTPVIFGEENSRAMIGIQMASAYAGTTIMPPVFGVIARNIGINLLPSYLLVILILEFITYRYVEIMHRK